MVTALQLILLDQLTASGAVTSATIYGAAGADTLQIGALTSASTLDGGTGVSDFNLEQSQLLPSLVELVTTALISLLVFQHLHCGW